MGTLLVFESQLVCLLAASVPQVPYFEIKIMIALMSNVKIMLST
jgi:hypothetical protein